MFFARGLMGAGMAVAASAASAQTQNSTTNCYNLGYSVQCNTNTTTQPAAPTINPRQYDPNAYQRAFEQSQQNTNQAFQNLGAAIAEGRERKRQRREAEAAQAQANAQKARDDAVTSAMYAAIERDNAPAPPAPPEKPVLLSCAIGEHSTSLALYETAGRVDVTEAGVTKARTATFTPNAVTWEGSVWRTAVSRIDMSLISIARLPEMAGAQVTGTCSLAERKF